MLHVFSRLCSHLHVVALLSFHFRIDAKLLSGTQNRYLRPVQTEYTNLVLKDEARKKNTVEHTYVAFNTSNVRGLWETDEHKTQVRIITNELSLSATATDTLHSATFAWEQWEAMSSSLHCAVENLGFVMTDQPDKLGLPLIASYSRGGCHSYMHQIMTRINARNFGSKCVK